MKNNILSIFVVTMLVSSSLCSYTDHGVQVERNMRDVVKNSNHTSVVCIPSSESTSRKVDTTFQYKIEKTAEAVEFLINEIIGDHYVSPQDIQVLIKKIAEILSSQKADDKIIMIQAISIKLKHMIMQCSQVERKSTRSLSYAYGAGILTFAGLFSYLAYKMYYSHQNQWQPILDVLEKKGIFGVQDKGMHKGNYDIEYHYKPEDAQGACEAWSDNKTSLHKIIEGKKFWSGFGSFFGGALGITGIALLLKGCTTHDVSESELMRYDNLKNIYEAFLIEFCK